MSMPPKFSPIPLYFSNQAKQIETDAMIDICRRNNLLGTVVKDIAWRRGTYCPNHDALAVSFIPTYSRSMHMIVELVPTEDYPYQEPAAIVIKPDTHPLTTRFNSYLHLHTHPDPNLHYRIICSYLAERNERGWNSQANLGKYFLNCVLLWAYHFDRFLSTNGAWDVTKWK